MIPAMPARRGGRSPLVPPSPGPAALQLQDPMDNKAQTVVKAVRSSRNGCHMQTASEEDTTVAMLKTLTSPVRGEICARRK